VVNVDCRPLRPCALERHCAQSARTYRRFGTPWPETIAISGAWIRLHTNAPHHRAALLPLCCSYLAELMRASVTAAVRTWEAAALETAIVDAGDVPQLCTALLSGRGILMELQYWRSRWCL